MREGKIGAGSNAVSQLEKEATNSFLFSGCIYDLGVREYGIGNGPVSHFVRNTSGGSMMAAEIYHEVIPMVEGLVLDKSERSFYLRSHYISWNSTQHREFMSGTSCSNSICWSSVMPN